MYAWLFLNIINETSAELIFQGRLASSQCFLRGGWNTNIPDNIPEIILRDGFDIWRVAYIYIANVAYVYFYWRTHDFEQAYVDTYAHFFLMTF